MLLTYAGLLYGPVFMSCGWMYKNAGVWVSDAFSFSFLYLLIILLFFYVVRFSFFFARAN